jgi:hypothetical protein
MNGVGWYGREWLEVPPGVGYHGTVMPFPIKVCTICSEEFELKPDKPGFANRCPECSAMDEAEVAAKRGVVSASTVDKGLNEARRNAMRDLLYRKDS